MRTKNTVFVAKTGKMLVMDPDIPNKETFLYSPNGRTFHVIYGGVGQGSYSGDEVKETGHFHVPSLGVEGPFERANNSLRWIGEVFTADGTTLNLRSIDAVPLPRDRKPEYLAVSEDGSLVLYVSASKYEYLYDSFRLFIGNGKQMHEATVRQVVRRRDGGSTTIETDKGTFFSPSPFHKGKKATWSPDVTMIETPRNKITDLYRIAENKSGAVASVIKK